jgi:polynucleotide 5'-hydroxyl-kinase GRC3/NOL9
LTNQPLDIPPTWEQIDSTAIRGTLMVIGAPDTGKSTFARYLYRRLCRPSRRVAFLDGDPGQSTLGPPSTLTLAMDRSGDDTFPPAGQRWRRFVQAISPRGHMLPLLVSAARLVQTAQEAGVEVIIYDTTGLVDPAQGGVNLKLAKIELLQPSAVFAIQRGQELNELLAPLRRNRHTRLIEMQPSAVVQSRDVPTRQTHRASQFAHYFTTTRILTVDWNRLVVLPAPRFAYHQLVALEDAEGFTLGLGIVQAADMKTKQATLLTPLTSLAGVEALRLGDLSLDPKTFRDQPLRDA